MEERQLIKNALFEENPGFFEGQGELPDEIENLN